MYLNTKFLLGRDLNDVHWFSPLSYFSEPALTKVRIVSFLQKSGSRIHIVKPNRAAGEIKTGHKRLSHNPAVDLPSYVVSFCARPFGGVSHTAYAISPLLGVSKTLPTKVLWFIQL